MPKTALNQWAHLVQQADENGVCLSVQAQHASTVLHVVSKFIPALKVILTRTLNLSITVTGSDGSLTVTVNITLVFVEDGLGAQL